MVLQSHEPPLTIRPATVNVSVLTGPYTTSCAHSPPREKGIGRLAFRRWCSAITPRHINPRVSHHISFCPDRTPDYLLISCWAGFTSRRLVQCRTGSWNTKQDFALLLKGHKNALPLLLL